MSENENENEPFCPVCGREMEDTRHVAVECFYAVQEFVPDAKELTVFTEVPADAPIWGITRQYREGTRDEHYSESGEPLANGIPVTHIKTKQVPIEPIRLLEQNLYSVTCCKACRADFLSMFKKWRYGGFARSKGAGDIPIRVGGAIKYVSRAEWDWMQEDAANDYDALMERRYRAESEQAEKN